MSYLDIVLEASAWLPGSPRLLGGAKWKEGQAAPASAEETTQLLKGECEGLEWSGLSCRIYHSDSEIKGVRLLSWSESRSSSRICGSRERGKGDVEGGGGEGWRGAEWRGEERLETCVGMGRAHPDCLPAGR